MAQFYGITNAAKWSTMSAWGASVNYVPGTPITQFTSFTNNGSSKVRVNFSVATNPAWVVGDVLWIAGCTDQSSYNGRQVVTAIGATYVDIGGLAYGSADSTTGTVRRLDKINHYGLVYLDVNVTVGDNTGTYWLNFQNGCNLVICSGVTLTANCYVLGVGASGTPANLSLSGGATVLFGGAGLTSIYNHSTAFSTLTNPNAAALASIPTGTTVTTPSSGNRATITNAAGGAGWYFSGGPTYNVSYHNFTGGTSGTPFLNVASIGAGSTYLFDHCIFTSCGVVNIGPAEGTSPCAFTYCTWRTSLNTYTVSLTPTAAAGAAQRALTNCYFDKRLNVGSYGAWGFTINDCVFNDTWDWSGLSTNGNTVSFQRCLIRTQTNGHVGYQALGNMSNCYHLIDASDNNTFFLQPPINQNIAVDNQIFDAPFQNVANGGSYGNIGDCFYNYSTGSNAVTHSISYSISLPITIGDVIDGFIGRGATSGNIQSGEFQTASSIQVFHNTILSTSKATNGTAFASNEGVGPYLGEDAVLKSTYGTGTRMTILRDNLYWDSQNCGNYGFVAFDYSTGSYFTPPNDYVLASACGHNAFWQFAKTPAGTWTGTGATYANSTYYNYPATSTPGVGDVPLLTPPGFVDSTRCFLTWAAMLQATTLTYGAGNNGATILAAAMAAFSHMNDDSGFDTRYTVPALNTWVRAGFAPTNSQVKAAASDGTDIGAVAGIFGGPFPFFLDVAMTGGYQSLGF